MKAISYTVFFIFIFFTDALSQEVSVSAKFDSTSVFIGDQTWFRIRVEKPSSFLLTIQKLSDSISGGIIVLAGPVGDTVDLKTGRTVISHNYLVTAFDSGRYEVKPVSAGMVADGHEKRYFSDYSYINFKRVAVTPPDTSTGYFDIIRPYRAPLKAGDIIPWYLALSLLAVFIWFSILIAGKILKRKPETVTEKDPDPAHIIALRELDKLCEDQLWQKGELKEYHSRLTEILRSYIDKRFGISAMELTTGETLIRLRRSGVKNDAVLEIIRTLLVGADLVKFAKYLPDSAENELYMDHAYRFVNTTRLEEDSVNSPSGDDIKPEEIR